MNIMLIGDICGRPGRKTVKHFLPTLRQEFNLDIVIANGENSAGGIGITASTYGELMDLGIDVITSGNHIWDKKEIFEFIERENVLIRPANYPEGTPGKGYCIIDKSNKRIGVINLAGRAFMPPIDCPFRAVDVILQTISNDCDIIIVDFHAETTSEKMALAWYLDGKVSCVAGTHTHIQTADERILPGGTAYITDLGMVGPWNSILGVDKELVIKKFITGLPVRFNLAEGPTVFSAIIIQLNDTTNTVEKIHRVLKFLD